MSKPVKAKGTVTQEEAVHLTELELYKFRALDAETKNSVLTVEKAQRRVDILIAEQPRIKRLLMERDSLTHVLKTKIGVQNIYLKTLRKKYGVEAGKYQIDEDDGLISIATEDPAEWEPLTRTAKAKSKPRKRR